MTFAKTRAALEAIAAEAKDTFGSFDQTVGAVLPELERIVREAKQHRAILDKRVEALEAVKKQGLVLRAGQSVKDAAAECDAGIKAATNEAAELDALLA